MDSNDASTDYNFADNILTSFGGGFLSIVFGLVLLIIKNKMCQNTNCELDSGCLKIDNHVREDDIIKSETLREICIEHRNKGEEI